MATFDLIHQPWVPCILNSGERVELGLHDTLARATEIREIEDGSPLVTVALHRLLLAILHRNFGPRSLNAWRDLWNRGAWEIRVLEGYFERWGDRFDLFHPVHPFGQVPEMPDAKRQPIAALMLERASGNNVTLFDHTVSEKPAGVAPAVAGRNLLTYQLYAGCGGVSTPFNLTDATLARGRTVLVQGDNLFETLCLNLVVYNEQLPIPWLGEDDPPIWERDVLRPPVKNGTMASGYLDYLTFRVRRIHLVPPQEGDETVRWCQIQQWYAFGGNELPDPFMGYRSDEKTGTFPVLLSANKSVWRDSDTLFAPQKDTIARPEVFTFLGRVNELRAHGEITAQPTYRFAALGVRRTPGQPTIQFWRHERLPLPLAYLDDAALRLALDCALKLAEDAGRALTYAATTFGQWLFVPDLSADKNERKKQLSGRDKDVKNIVADLAPGQFFWPALEAPFAHYLVAQAAEREEARKEPGFDGELPVPVGAALRVWDEAVTQAARRDAAVMLGSMDSTARVLKARVKAEGAFAYALKKARTEAGVGQEGGANDG